MKFIFYCFVAFLIAGIGSCQQARAQAVDNTIAMSYASMTLYQQIVLSTAQKAGGTFTFSVQAMDGGGRGPPNYPQDVANLSLQFFNSSGTLIGTATSNNSTVFNTFNTYTVSTANCGGGGCANVYFMRVNMTGNDGGYWAGNAGTNFKAPVLTFAPTGGSVTAPNLLYNPEFGVYGTYASNSAPHGWWNSTNAWGGNTHPQILNNNGTLNYAAGGYLVQGGTLSGTVGGYPAMAAAPVYASSITSAQQNRVNAAAVTRAGITHNGIYIDQVGNNNQINVSQVGSYNQVSGIGATNAPVQGDLNTITIRQGDPANPVGKNLIEMSVQGTGSNTLNLNQGRDTNGNYTGIDVGNHYQSVSVAGYSNQVTTNQQNAGGSVGHYLEANIVGNYNTVGLVQTDGTTQKQTFASVNGNNNVLNASQTGLGNHYLDISLNGNGNSATVSQYGNTANAATLSLTNAGGPASVNLTQTGGQVYNITTVCVTAGGCAPITVRQGN